MDLLIVDGYNIIHALDRYRDLQKQDRQAAVNKLITDMVNLTGAAEADITVVFDGRGEGGTLEVGRVKVVYTREGQSADTVIERLVFSQDGEKTIGVCTADWAQQKVVGRRGVKRMAPRELDDMMTAEFEEAQDDRPADRRARLEDRLPPSVRRRLDEMRRP